MAWVLKTGYKEKLDVISQVNLKPQSNNDRGFELDVLAKYGYQICGISCGTAMKKERLSNTLKNKGFEVILRSQEIGGEEARSVLVTLLDANIAKKLEDDLRACTGAGKDRFIVLGRDDLAVDVMREKLEDHIFK